MFRIALFPLASALTLGFAALVLAVPASAQVGASASPRQPAFDADRIVTKVQQADLVELVRNSGDTIVSQREQGDVSVLAQTPSGLYYVLVGAACDRPDYGEGCLGIDFQVRYTADEQVTMENINLANLTYSAAKVSLGVNEGNESTVFITHYVILDGGQKMGNLATILINVLDFGPKASSVIWP